MPINHFHRGIVIDVLHILNVSDSAYDKKKRKKNAVRPSVQVLTLVNIFQKSRNLYMLFASDIKWTVEKMVCMELRIRLQRHTKVFWCIKVYGGEKF